MENVLSVPKKIDSRICSRDAESVIHFDVCWAY